LIAPREHIKLIARTATETVVRLKLDGKEIGYKLVIGRVSRFTTRLTSPPTTKKIAAKSTIPCFNGEAAFIFFKPQRCLVLHSC
jgi:hypothetical protein